MVVSELTLNICGTGCAAVRMGEPLCFAYALGSVIGLTPSCR